VIRKILFVILLITTNFANSQNWQAKWISSDGNNSAFSSFFAFRKQINISQIPSSVVIAKIAVDTKYFLWINNKLVVFEGGLKRGPNPTDTYYDEIDISSFLQIGNNSIAILVWYYGIDGFSHKSSGKAGLLFDCQSSGLQIFSDATWQCKLLDAYQISTAPKPNSRLSESSVLYDARNDIGIWQSDFSIPFKLALEFGTAGDPPWNQLVKRPIPLWKDYGLKNYTSFTSSNQGDITTYSGQLPYNAQVNPYFKIDSPEAGLSITVNTDNYKEDYAGETGICFEYITKKGVQEFELPGWLNGHKVYYGIPKSVKLIDSKFRETGFNTDFEGSFQCDDPFFNKLWNKAARTVYLNMRDNFMDCPDRERAQWAGDAVHESQIAFYAFSPTSDQLIKKWLLELLNWRDIYGGMHAPVPGNWDLDMPDQTLTAIGYYGLWTYYMHTGDKQMLIDFYPAIKRYFNHFQFDELGLIKSRNVFPFWGDRTDNKDIKVIVNSLYYMVLKCLQQSALVLDKADEYAQYSIQMQQIRAAFNQKYWNGTLYRDPEYQGANDERAQALAVVAGLVDQDKYASIFSIFQNEEHASSYMEKYVMEALFQMGYANYALERHKKRFANMVNDTQFSTLWEDWYYGKGVNGSSSNNHAWSGGGLIVLSQYLCGISPIEAGYTTFQICPTPTKTITTASATVSSVKGIIKSNYSFTPGKFTLDAVVPNGSMAVIGVQNIYQRIKLNGKVIWEIGFYKTNPDATAVNDSDSSLIKFKVKNGNWNIEAITFLQAQRSKISIDSLNKLDTLMCKGDTIVLSGNPSSQNLWFKNDTLILNNATGYLNIWDSGYYYSIMLNPLGGYNKSPTMHVMLNNSYIPATLSITMNSNNELVANSNNVIQWYQNSILIIGATNNFFKPMVNAYYTAKTTIDGCTSSPSFPIFYVAQALFQIDSKNYISFFPNPVNDKVNIYYQLANNESLQVIIYALNGRKLMEFENVYSGDMLQVEKLSRGVYPVLFITKKDKKQFTGQLIKY
jgi:hypothetical protein